MSWIDIFFLVVFVIGLVKGYTRGLIVELFSLVGFFIGLFIAIELTIPVAERFFTGSDYFQMFTVLVFAGLFVLTVLAVSLVAKMIKKALDLTFLGFFDNILGALAGLLKWAFILSIFFWVFDSIGLRLPKHYIDESFIYPIVVKIGPAAFQWLSEILPFIKEMIDSLKDIGEKQGAKYTFL